MQTQPITDQIANISPAYVVLIVTAFTLLRIALAKANQPWARSVSETCDTINFVLILAFLLVRPFVAQAFYIPSASMRPTLIESDRLIVDKMSYRLQEPQRRDVVVFNAPAAATDEGIDGIDFIKRLVAVPGDTIEVRAARLQIGEERVEADEYSGTPHDYLRNHLDLGPDDAVKFFPDYVLVNGTRRITKDEIARAVGRQGEPVIITPGETLVNNKKLYEPYTREDPGYNMHPTLVGVGELFMLGDNRNQSRDSHIWGALERRRVVGRARFVFWPLPRVGVIR